MRLPQAQGIEVRRGGLAGKLFEGGEGGDGMFFGQPAAQQFQARGPRGFGFARGNHGRDTLKRDVEGAGPGPFRTRPGHDEDVLEGGRFAGEEAGRYAHFRGVVGTGRFQETRNGFGVPLLEDLEHRGLAGGFALFPGAGEFVVEAFLARFNQCAECRRADARMEQVAQRLGGEAFGIRGFQPENRFAQVFRLVRIGGDALVDLGRFVIVALSRSRYAASSAA